MRLADLHLVELGHERIGLATGPRRFVPVIRKIEGFIAAKAQLLGVDEHTARRLIAHTLFSVDGGQPPRARWWTAAARRSSAAAT